MPTLATVLGIEVMRRFSAALPDREHRRDGKPQQGPQEDYRHNLGNSRHLDVINAFMHRRGPQ